MQINAVFYGWWILGVAFFIQMLGSGTIVYSYSVVAVPLGAEFEASRTAMMFGITAMSLCSALVSPVLGRAIDRYSIRTLIIIASLALALGYFLLSFVNAMWQVPIIYAVCMSVATLILGPLAASTLLARWFENKLGMVMGVAAVGVSLGGFIFPPIIEWMIGEFEWRSAFRLLSLLILILAIPAAVLAVNHPKDKGLRAYGSIELATSDESTHARQPESVLKNRNFWLVAIVVSGLFAVYTALLSNLVPIAMDAGVSREQGAVLISIIAACGVAGKLIFGLLADRIDLRIGLAVAILLLITGLACFLGEGFNLLLVGSVAIGLAAGGMLPVWGAILAWLFGVDNYGRVMGQMNPIIVPMYMLAPLFMGLIYDRTGSYSAAFMLFMSILCLLLFLLPGIRHLEEA